MKIAIWLIAIAQWWTIGENRYYSWSFRRKTERPQNWESNLIDSILRPYDWDERELGNDE